MVDQGFDGTNVCQTTYKEGYSAVFTSVDMPGSGAIAEVLDPIYVHDFAFIPVRLSSGGKFFTSKIAQFIRSNGSLPVGRDGRTNTHRIRQSLRRWLFRRVNDLDRGVSVRLSCHLSTS